jgi:hypothetical protein
MYYFSYQKRLEFGIRQGQVAAGGIPLVTPGIFAINAGSVLL